MSHFLVGDETGLLKIIDGSTKDVKSYGQQSRSLGIVSVNLFDDSGKYGVTRRNGQFEVWGLEDGLFGMLSSYESSIDNPISSAPLLNSNQSIIGSIILGSNGNLQTIRSTSDKAIIGPKIVTDGPISACESLRDSQVLFGGKENDVKLFDFESQSCKWSAKNVPRDNLNLRVPIWITAITAVDHNCFYTGTAYKHLRFYDIRTSSQPIKSINVSEDFRICSLKYNENLNLLYVADTAGNAGIYDPTTLRMKYTFKGITGAVRCMSLSAKGKNVGIVGLDRHLRVYNGSNSQLINTIYLTNRSNTCTEFLQSDALQDDECIEDHSTNSELDASSNDDDDESAQDDSSNDFLQEMHESDFE